MKKLTMIFLSSLVLLTILALIGCEKSNDEDKAVIMIDVLSPASGDSVNVGDSITVTSKLSGFTYEYREVNYYFGNSTTPTATYDNSHLKELALTQEKDAQFDFIVSTADLVEGETNLVAEAVGKDYTAYSVAIPIVMKMPTGDDTAISFVVVAPADYTTFKIGDKISFEIRMEGNLTLFENFSAYIGDALDPYYTSSTAETTKKFDLDTEGMSAGEYKIKMDLTDKQEDVITRNFNFALIEYVPTFEVQGEAGYALKSTIQTYDNGYLAVSSDAAKGTKVVKYNKEGVEEWNRVIAASVGIAESVCEDTEYDKGYVIAGWRQNGTHKDTWVRKINMTDGGLIWNKQYGYLNVDDGATVIKKTIDDGYIVGGYTYNIYGTGSFTLPGDTLNVYTWETGYDVRLLKLYSNGNEVWGQNHNFVGSRLWSDISEHKIVYEDGSEFYWIEKMGDQYVTDIVVMDDLSGDYLVTGWNTNYLYFGDLRNYPTTSAEYINRFKKDMFFAHVDHFGSFISCTTWSRMWAFDIEHMCPEAELAYGGLNSSVVISHALGDITEEESGYGIVESFDAFSGSQVVMAGEAYETDDGPVKAKAWDAWVVDFGTSADEDGAMWENAFGEAAKNEKAYGIDRTVDGGYIITGYNTGTDKNTWLLKLDDHLSLLWAKTLGITGDDVGVKVLQATDGGFIIGCNVGTGTSAKSRLIKLNKFGNSSK